MIQHQGIWLPDGETHLTHWMTKSGEIVDGKGTYQIKKLRRAVAHCKRLRTAVDVGAHVGMWTMQLAKKFSQVHSFEPVAAHRDCFVRNIDMPGPYDQTNDERGGYTNVTLHRCALGEIEGKVNIYTAPSSSGDSYVDNAAHQGDIPLCRLDTFDLSNVDFIKLDCEGYEYFALRGGEETIKRDKPVIIVEQKPGKAQKFGLSEQGAVEYLRGLGYRQAEELSGDFIMVP